MAGQGRIGTEVQRSRGRTRLSRSLVGVRYGRLVVQGYAGQHRTSGGRWQGVWRCFCDCGAEVLIRENHLLCGRTRSCGCLRRDGKHPGGRIRWEAHRRAQRRAAAMLWRPYYEMLHGLLRRKGLSRKLLALRLGKSIGATRLAALLRAQEPELPSMDEVELLVQAMNLRGMEKTEFEMLAREAREGMAAYEAGVSWAVERVAREMDNVPSNMRA